MSRLALLLPLVAAPLVPVVGDPAGDALSAPHGRRCHLLTIECFANFAQTNVAHPNQTRLISPALAAPFPWNELVVSWNAAAPAGTGLKIEARAVDPDWTSPYFTLGLWSEDPERHPRQSVNRQTNEYGRVQTDTLVLRQPARSVQVRVTLCSAEDQTKPELKFLSLSFLDRVGQAPWREPNRQAWGWGRIVPVPERTQLGYPGASGWCSPACVSMLLAYWAAKLNRPELDWTVPAVARAVHDPEWQGTGNWVFNTAFAGRFPGLRAYAARVQDLRAVEDWIAAGIPVAASVSSDVLRGAERDLGNGHLVVCVGFTQTGDVITNDPWAVFSKGETVQRVYARDVFRRSWERSKFTLYVIHPVPREIPPALEP